MAEVARPGGKNAARPRGLAWRLLVLLALFAGLGGGFACGEEGGSPQVGSETHFLTGCDQSCSGGAECLCGVCTQSCARSAECALLGADAACVSLAPRSAEGRCEAAAASVSMCDVRCLSADDCRQLGAEFECFQGYCRAELTPPSDGPATCVGPITRAGDVVVLGDALLELSTFTADLEQAAQGAGLLGANEHYRDYASSLLSILAAGTSFTFQNQYANAQADGPARVVIMDGGETDVLNVPCGSAPSSSCPQVLAAAAGAEALLASFVADGVEQLVYFFYADPVGNQDVKAGLDVLRPFIENACGRAALPCHFLDLRPVFEAHPEYAAADGLVFSDAGAHAAANAVFKVIQDRCVLQ